MNNNIPRVIDNNIPSIVGDNSFILNMNINKPPTKVDNDTNNIFNIAVSLSIMFLILGILLNITKKTKVLKK